jgi:DNA-binding GntR family transcriptional regulator
VGTNGNGFTAARVADALRRDVLEGVLGIDARLKENDLVERFAISRNTAREALRQLASEGLIVLRMHSGATVRRLELPDVRDVYAVRRILEPSAIMRSVQADQALFPALTDAVERGEAATARQAWQAGATASLDMHRAIVALHESPRTSAFFDHQLAQLRVAFWILPFETAQQAGWIERDRVIVDMIVSGQRSSAVEAMHRYLDDSEAQVIDAFRALERMSARPVRA